MSMDKQKRMVRLLQQKTSEDKLEWQMTTKDYIFQVSFSSGSLRLAERERENEYEASDYVVEVLNDENMTVDTFSDNDLDSTEPALEQGQKLIWYTSMRDLFEAARRTALGSEKVYNSILSDLEDDIPF